MERSEELSMDQAFLRKLTESVFTNLHNEQFGAEELAHCVGLSRSQVHRRLHKINGHSITQFIREIRLKEAHRLLEKDVGTASDVAYLVGFGSPTYFNTCFHDFYGYTPGDLKPKRSSDPKLSEKSDDSDAIILNEEGKRSNRRLRPILLLTATLILLLGSYSIWDIHRKARIKWATYQAIPEIQKRIEEAQILEAQNLALKAEKYIQNDPELNYILSRLFSRISIETDPPGADIYVKNYDDFEGDWKFIGRSPIKEIRLRGNLYRSRILKDGYEPVLAVLNPNVDSLYRKLDKTGSLPPGMVRGDW